MQDSHRSYMHRTMLLTPMYKHNGEASVPCRYAAKYAKRPIAHNNFAHPGVQAMGSQGNKGNGLACGCLGHLICWQPLTILWPMCIVVAAHHVSCRCIQPAHKQCSAQASRSCLCWRIAHPGAYTCHADTPPRWLPVLHPAAILKLVYRSSGHTVVRHVYTCADSTHLRLRFVCSQRCTVSPASASSLHVE